MRPPDERYCNRYLASRLSIGRQDLTTTQSEPYVSKAIFGPYLRAEFNDITVFEVASAYLSTGRPFCGHRVWVFAVWPRKFQKATLFGPGGPRHRSRGHDVSRSQWAAASRVMSDHLSKREDHTLGVAVRHGIPGRVDCATAQQGD